MEIINHIEIREDNEDKAFIQGTNKKAEVLARIYDDTEYTIVEVMEQY